MTCHYEFIRGLYEQFADVAYLHPDHYHRAIVARAGGDEQLRKRIYRYFRMRMSAHGNPRNLVVLFRPWLVPDTAALSSVFLEELTKSIGPLLGADVEDAMKNYTAVIKRLAPVAGVAAQALVPGSGSAIRDLLASFGTQRDVTLESRKTKLESSLKKLRDQKVVVVIDDLDRLNPKEANEIIGLVKSLGNLPNIVYLMSYDPIVLCGLRKELGLNAEAYLEKIIQYRRSLPLLPVERTLTLLDSCRNEIFDQATPELLDRARDATFYVLRQYIRTRRDAIRCGDWTTRAHRILKNQTDPVDLLILEVLNAKDSPLYQWISRHLDQLCNGPVQTFKEMLEADDLKVTEERMHALSQLFPHASREFHRPANTSSNDRLNKRINIRDYAETYFELSEPVTGSGKLELNRLFESDDPRMGITTIVARSRGAEHGSSIRAELLDTIWEHFSRNPITRGWLGALIDFGPELISFGDRDTDDIFADDNLRRLTGAIMSGLGHLNAEEKIDLVKLMVARSEDLSLAASVLRRIGSARQEAHEAGYVNLEAISEELMDKLQRTVTEDSLLASAYPAHVVYLAAEVVGKDIIRNYINDALQHDRYFPAIAQTLLNEGNSSDRGHFYFFIRNIEDFADLSLFMRVATNHVGDIGEVGVWAKRVMNAWLRRQRGKE